MRFHTPSEWQALGRAGPTLDQRVYDCLVRGLLESLRQERQRCRAGPPRVFSRLAELRAALCRACSSVFGEIGPDLALRFQDRTGNEIAFDWIVERATGRRTGLVTRGDVGMAASNLLFYFSLNKRFQVRTGFHTHPSIDNHLGRFMPSVGDFLALRGERLLIGGRSPVASVYFPDGTRTRYALVSDSVGVVRIGHQPPRRVGLVEGLAD